MNRFIVRLPLLIASVGLLDLSVHAAVPLLTPDSERYLLGSVTVGLVLCAYWRWAGWRLALVTLVGAPVVTLSLSRWFPDALYRSQATGVGLGSGAVAPTLSPAAVILLAICTAILAVCCGRLLFEHRTPWPAVALASSAFLLRANVTRVYEERLPLFLVAAIVVVVLCHAAGDRRLSSRVPVIGLSAILIALCWQLPTAIHAWSPAFGNSIGRAVGTGIPGGGGSVLQLSGAFHPNNRPVMSIATNLLDARPYWRTTIFDRYDGHSWTSSVNSERYIAANQLVSTTLFNGQAEVVTAVQVLEPMAELASAGTPVRASLPSTGQFGTANDVISLRAVSPLTPGTMYEVDGTFDQGGGASSASRFQASASRFQAPVSLQPYLQLPGNLSRVHQLAAQITHPYATALLRVLALESYLRDSGRFQYDLQAGSPTEGDAVDNFLFVSQRGYCNQFATALVVLAREVGIPARLIAGYTTGTAGRGAYLVRERDAHSWVEAYLPDTGWIALDPTPGFHADPALITDPKGKLPTALQIGPNHQVPPGQAGGLGWRRRWSYHPPAAPTPPPPPIDAGWIGQSISSYGSGLTVPVGVTGLLLWLILYFFWPRSLPQLYRTLRRAVPARYGSLAVSDTPLTFMERFQPGDGSATAVQVIVRLYIRQQYTDRMVDQSELRAARRAWRRLRVRWLMSSLRPSTWHRRLAERSATAPNA